MKYKSFKYNKQYSNWNVVIEYEDDKIISAHFTSKTNSNTTDIILLKKNIAHFNYLNCTFYNNKNKYNIEYISNFKLSNNGGWTDKDWRTVCALDENMDLTNRGFDE